MNDNRPLMADRVEQWIRRMEEFVDRYKLTRWSRMTPQERWDDQNDGHDDYCRSQERIARVAEWCGWTSAAQKVRREVMAKRWMRERALRCPNNPANGGACFDHGDGTWRDRRGSDWEIVEDYLVRLDQ